ncbi:hypothetical protein [Synechococcus sp.]
MSNFIRQKLAVFSRHLTQATAACITTMTNGNVASVTLAHWQIALTTGLIAGVIGVAISFTRLFRGYKHTNSNAIITFISTLVADTISHPSKPGAPLWGHGEAFLTAFGAALISLVVSFTPIGATVERLKQPEFDDIK